MNSGFISDVSKIAWDMFAETGKIGFYMLYSHIENPPKELQIDHASQWQDNSPTM